MNKLSTTILTLLVLSCATCTSDGEQSKIITSQISPAPKTDWTDILESLKNYNRTGQYLQQDSVWQVLLSNEQDFIGYLLEIRGNREIVHSIPFLKSPESRATGYSAVTAEVAALYLICSVYYNDPYFAKERILVRNENLERYTLEGDTQLVELAQKTELPFYETSSDEIRLAWSEVDTWINKYEHDLDKARNANARPFGNSDLFWIGEIGCKASW